MPRWIKARAAGMQPAPVPWSSVDLSPSEMMAGLARVSVMSGTAASGIAVAGTG